MPTFMKDGTNVRKLKSLFVKDGSVVRKIKKLWAKDGNIVRLIYSGLQQLFITGLVNTVDAGEKEVVTFGVDTEFTGGLAVGALSGDGVAYTSTTDVAVTTSSGLNSNYPFSVEGYDSANEWTIQSNGRIQYSGVARTVSTSLEGTVTITSNGGGDESSVGQNMSIRLYTGNSDVTGTNVFLDLVSSATGTHDLDDGPESITLNPGDQLGVVIRKLQVVTNNFTVNSIDLRITIGGDPVSISTGLSSYNISNTSENIPAITNNFIVGSNATTARNTIKSALSSDAEFNGAFDFTEDTDIAPTSTTVDVTFGGTLTAFTPPNSSVTVGFRLVLPTTLLGSAATSGQVTTIAQVIDLLVVSFNAIGSETSGATASRVGTNVLRFTPISGTVLYTGLSLNASDFGTGLEGVTISIAIPGETDTDIITPFAFSNGFLTFGGGNLTNTFISTGTRLAARYTAKVVGDFEDFTFTITENGGENTTPYLEATTDGADSTPATVVNISLPNEAISISSGASLDAIGAEIAASNTEILYDPTDVNDTETFTVRDTSGFVNAGSWDLRDSTSGGSLSQDFTSWDDWIDNFVRYDPTADITTKLRRLKTLTFTIGSATATMTGVVTTSGTDSIFRVDAITSQSGTPSNTEQTMIISYTLAGTLTLPGESVITITNNHPTDPLTFTDQ